MKLTKTKKILLLGTTLAILTTSVAVPIVLLNKDEKNQENDVEKLFKILKAKTIKEKVIELLNNASGKIIANNQDKIIEKIKILIGQQNLKNVKIEVLMKDDANISTTLQKIIIKLTKNEFSKEIKGFLVKRNFTADEDIEAIKNILDAKAREDLVIILPSTSTGNIIGNASNKDEIKTKLRILIDSSNTNGEANHSSLRGTSIEVSMNIDAPISTTPQNILVSISKTGGTTLRTMKTFQVKRDFTTNEDIIAIKTILESKTGQDLIIILPSDSTGRILDNRIETRKKLMMLIDPSNTDGDPNHPSLRGTSLSFLPVNSTAIISTTSKPIYVLITKTGGTPLTVTGIFRIKKST